MLVHVPEKIFFILFGILFTEGRLPMCFKQNCQTGPIKDPISFQPCEPVDSNLNLAYFAKINIDPANATCGNPPIDICSLQNHFSCSYTCDDRVEGRKHGPEMMNDDNEWTWWQSHPIDMVEYSNYKINITLSFSKKFILTDDIKINFHDGNPDAMIVEKSSDFGETWMTLQYYSSNCRNQFNMRKVNHLLFLDLKNSVLPFCTESYSLNIDGKHSRGEIRIAIMERIKALSLRQDMEKNEVCKSLYSKSALKKFLEITDLRIRLIRPPFLAIQDKRSVRYLRSSGHYGIKSVHISGRCQCNGHSGECVVYNGSLNCNCAHNTFGSDCQKCKPLFWMFPWKPATYLGYKLHNPNPCLSYYSIYYRQKWLPIDPFGNNSLLSMKPVKNLCECNGHSDRCEFVENTGEICVDCRHNTEGKNCHLCKYGHYRKNGTKLNDVHTCQACNCDLTGSVYASCLPFGHCHCKANYTGRRCDQCASGYYRGFGGKCLRVSCCLPLCQIKKCASSNFKSAFNQKTEQRENISITSDQSLLNCNKAEISACACNSKSLSITCPKASSAAREVSKTKDINSAIRLQLQYFVFLFLFIFNLIF